MSYLWLSSRVLGDVLRGLLEDRMLEVLEGVIDWYAGRGRGTAPDGQVPSRKETDLNGGRSSFRT
jgi:hypothetical protein